MTRLETAAVFYDYCYASFTVKYVFITPSDRKIRASAATADGINRADWDEC